MTVLKILKTSVTILKILKTSMTVLENLKSLKSFKRLKSSQRFKKRGGKSWECRVISFTAGKAKKDGKMNYFTGICAIKSLARRVTTNETQSATHAFSGSRKQNHDFLKNQGFCAAGENGTGEGGQQ